MKEYINIYKYILTTSDIAVVFFLTEAHKTVSEHT